MQLGGSSPVGDDDHYLGGTEGLKGVFRDGRSSEAAERFLDAIERALEPVGRVSEPAGKALDPAGRASNQLRRAWSQKGFRAT